MDIKEKLAELRKEIDETDVQLNKFFHKRMRTSEKIAKVKAESGAAAEDKDREKEVIGTAVSAADSDMKRETESFFRTLISLSKIRQAENIGRTGNIAGLRPFTGGMSFVNAGCLLNDRSQSRKAAAAMFFGSAVTLYDDCADVIEAIKHNEISRGIFQADNSRMSPAVQIYDLLEESSCFITDEAYIDADADDLPKKIRYIAAAGQAESGGNRDTVLAALCVPEISGALNEVLQTFILSGIGIDRIESGKDSYDGRNFYVHLHADLADKNTRSILAHAALQCTNFSILGYYTAAE